MKAALALLCLLAAPARAENPVIWGGGLEGFPRFQRAAEPPAGVDVPLMPRTGLGSLLLAKDLSERAALDRIIAHMMSAPTARELAPEFLALNRAVRVIFDPEIETRVIQRDGRLVLDGEKGFFEDAEHGPSVHISPLYRDPAWLDEAASTLAHELLGHATMNLKNKAVAGILLRHVADETYASLVGSAVGLELGDLDIVEESQELAGDRASVEAARAEFGLGYSLTLTTAEMADARGAYEARLARYRRDIAQAEARLPTFGFYREAVDHFRAEHGAPASEHAALLEELEGIRAGTARRIAKLTKTADFIQTHIGRLDSGRAKPSAAELARGASHPAVADLEARVARLTPRVLALASALALRRAPVPAPVRAAPDAIDVLLDRVKQDAPVHPDFWEPVLERLRAKR